MTIAEALIQWMQGFDGGIEIKDVDTDQLAANAQAYGLFKSPADTVTEFVDGSRDTTSYLQFIVRQPSQTDAMRTGNRAWMEAFEAWVRRMNFARDLPQLDGGRECYAVGIANSFYLEEQTETESVYQINLMISYTTEREG